MIKFILDEKTYLVRVYKELFTPILYKGKITYVDTGTFEEINYEDYDIDILRELFKIAKSANWAHVEPTSRIRDPVEADFIICKMVELGLNISDNLTVFSPCRMVPISERK